MSLVCTFYCVNICIPVSTILSSFQISTDSFVLGDNGLYLKEWECFSGIIFPGWTRVCSTSVLWRFFSPLPAPFCAGTRQLWAGKCESHFRGWAPSASLQISLGSTFCPDHTDLCTVHHACSQGMVQDTCTKPRLLHNCFVYSEHVIYFPQLELWRMADTACPPLSPCL